MAGVVLKQSGAPKIEDGENEFQSYANVAGIMLTNDEVTLHFAIRKFSGEKEAEENKAIGVAKIYIGLAHAKRLAMKLGQSITEYEKIFGEIMIDPAANLPPEKIEALKKDKK